MISHFILYESRTTTETEENTKSNAEIGKEKREFLPSVNCIRHMYNNKNTKKRFNHLQQRRSHIRRKLSLLELRCWSCWIILFNSIMGNTEMYQKILYLVNMKHKFWWFYLMCIPNCISGLKNETNQRYIPKHKIFHRTEQIINSDLVPWSWACKIVHKSRMPTYNIPSNRERRKYLFF